MTTLIERLEALTAPQRRVIERLDCSGDCWLWTGALDESGRGRVWLGGKNKIHHRAVWEILVGPIPQGALLCHHCDNPTCANPTHLYVGTSASNAMDMVSRGRHWTAKEPERAKLNAAKLGKTNTWHRREGNPKAKLSNEQVKSIMTSHIRTGILSKQYGVHRCTIQRIRNGKAWA